SFASFFAQEAAPKSTINAVTITRAFFMVHSSLENGRTAKASRVAGSSSLIWQPFRVKRQQRTGFYTDSLLCAPIAGIETGFARAGYQAVGGIGGPIRHERLEVGGKGLLPEA